MLFLLGFVCWLSMYGLALCKMFNSTSIICGNMASPAPLVWNKNILISRSDTAFVDANGERIHSGIFRVGQSINQTDWQGVTKRRPVSINANHQMSVASLFISIFLGQKEGELFWSCGTAHSDWQPISEEYFAFGFILRNWNIITIVSGEPQNCPLGGQSWGGQILYNGTYLRNILEKRLSCTHRGSGFF